LNAYSGSIHVSFDYAQQIQVPNLPQQPGPLYFLVPYKVGLFGIMNDTLRVQHNIVIPEACFISKGANAVVSFLHYYLETICCGAEVFDLQTDNCVAQIKNNVVLAYLAWRVLTGRNQSIT